MPSSPSLSYQTTPPPCVGAPMANLLLAQPRTRSFVCSTRVCNSPSAQLIATLVPASSVLSGLMMVPFSRLASIARLRGNGVLGTCVTWTSHFFWALSARALVSPSSTSTVSSLRSSSAAVVMATAAPISSTRVSHRCSLSCPNTCSLAARRKRLSQLRPNTSLMLASRRFSVVSVPQTKILLRFST